MKTLERTQIVGVAIRRVRHDHRARGEAGWLDTAQTYFTLDSGVSFVIPSSAFVIRCRLPGMAAVERLAWTGAMTEPLRTRLSSDAGRPVLIWSVPNPTKSAKVAEEIVEACIPDDTS